MLVFLNFLGDLPCQGPCSSWISQDTQLVPLQEPVGMGCRELRVIRNYIRLQNLTALNTHMQRGEKAVHEWAKQLFLEGKKKPSFIKISEFFILKKEEGMWEKLLISQGYVSP
jgi:hypothetical protein